MSKPPLAEVVQSLKTLMLENGIHKDKRTGMPYFTGYNYLTLYDWDQYFEAITLYYLGASVDVVQTCAVIAGSNRQRLITNTFDFEWLTIYDQLTINQFYGSGANRTV